MNEIWRSVSGYEGSYEVSTLGRVRSLDRVDSRGNHARGRMLAQDSTASGHRRVALCRLGKVRRFFVHRLVLTAFVTPQPEGMECCHNDGDPSNNVVGNLRWDTKSANARDRRRHGTDHHAAKTHCPNGHEYSNGNTYLSDGGHRRCRACTLSGQHARKESINARRRQLRADKRRAA